MWKGKQENEPEVKASLFEASLRNETVNDDADERNIEFFEFQGRATGRDETKRRDRTS
jgi:hypothetical protein